MKRSPKNLKKYKGVCKEIWEEREHICEICKRPIGEYDYDSGEMVPTYSMFHHINGRWEKGSTLDKDNIILLCSACHHNQHN